MKTSLSKIAVAALWALSSLPAWSQQVIDEYIAVIGAEDRMNSRGKPLTKVEQILQQDRANFHRYGIRHAGDTSDQFFSAKANRGALAQLLDRGSLRNGVESTILHGANTKLRVQIIGQAGRLESLRVYIAEEAAPVSGTQAEGSTAPAMGTTTLGSLPSQGTGDAVWQFERDENDWRGTASVGSANGFDVAFGCTKPGADPALYPGGGHVRPHEPGVYNLFIAPSSLGRDYGAPGAQTFTMEFSVDGQPFGAAPVVLLAPEMSLATNIPANHPFIQGLRSGSTLNIRDQASGAALDVPLSGSAAALDALAAFCATPLQPSAPLIASPAAPTKPETGTEDTPIFAPQLSCRLGNRSGVDTLYRLNCKYADGNRLDTPKKQQIQAQLALRTLGCDVPIIDGAPTSANGQCYFEMFGLEQQQLSDRDIGFLAKQHFYAKKSDLVAKLVEMGLNLAASPVTVADVGAASPSDQGGSVQSTAQPSGSSGLTIERDAGGILCERTPRRETQQRITCANSDGSTVGGRKLREAQAQYGLRVLGCEVPAITGVLSDSKEAVDCFNDMFGLEGRKLSETDIFLLADIASYSDRKKALTPFIVRGYQLASEKAKEDVVPAASRNLEIDETPAVRATLNLPDPRGEFFYKVFGFYSSDFMVPLVSEEIIDLNKHHQSVHGLLNGYTFWIRNNIRQITPLFLDGPSEWSSNSGGDTRKMWTFEIACVLSQPKYCEAPGSELFPVEIQSALKTFSKIRVCEYDRRNQPGTLIDTRSRGVPGLTVTVHFWAEPMPVVLSGRTLKSFPTSKTGMHPFMIIGPHLDACPSNLGLAAEYVAGQFPELVPLASESAPQIEPASGDVDPETETVSSLDDPRQELVRDLLGMSIAETRINVFGGEIENGTALIVDTVSEGGPAYRAGYRSGDYLWVIGWTPVGTIADLVRELERRQDNGAVVMTQAIPGENTPERNTVLIPFAQDTPDRFRKLTRDGESTIERAGWTTLAEDEYGISMSVYGDPWCGETVEAEYAQPLDANQVAYTNSDTFRAGYDAIQAQCPDMQKLHITSVSTTLGAQINVREVDFSADPPRSTKLGIDGMPPADTVSEAREIAAENAPLCDRLAAHPADANRRYGLEGVEFMLPDTLEEAINACIAEVEQNPDDPVTNFQLGRALFEAGLAEDAAGFFEIAAAAGHGGAFDYLGQMHYDGNGVEQDFELGDSYFDQALQAGFDPFAEPEKITFDTSGSAIASWFLEYNYDMDIKLMPSFANRTDINVGSEYNPTTLRALYHVTKNIAESCTDQGTINRLIAELEKDGAEIDDLEHAIFMYESYLPNIIPVMAQKVGVSASDINAPASETAFTLTSRYDCESVQLRQFVLNVAELVVR